MATITYNEKELYINGSRVVYPRDANFSVGSVLFGIDDATGAFVPIRSTADGKLSVSAAIVVEDIEIGAVEIKNSTSDDRVNVEADSGKMAMFVQTAYSTNKYYKDQSITPLTASYQSFALGFTAKDVIIINDSETSNIIVSLDGTNTHWTILPGEGFEFAKSSIATLSLKGAAGSESYRLMAC